MYAGIAVAHSLTDVKGRSEKRKFCNFKQFSKKKFINRFIESLKLTYIYDNL